MIDISDKSKCCGCTACKNVCPKACIRMSPDDEGFLYPQIDREECIACGLCEKVCPVINAQEDSETIPQSFVIQSENQEVLNKSTSGGFVYELSRYVGKNGGYFAGVKYDEDFMPEHCITNRLDELELFCGSKYAQSNLGNVFCEVKKLLKEGNMVLYVGTPCQVEGIKKYLRKDYHKLITVDFVCRSIPSPLLWKKYLDWQTKKNRAKIIEINCRKKTYGYHSGTLEIRFDNNKKYRGSNRVDYYMKAFHGNVCSRPSCYSCKFKKINRVSDFTVFDSWYPDRASNVKDNNRGYSNVLIHSGKALKIINEIESIKIWTANTEMLIKYTGGMIDNAVKKDDARELFYHDMKEVDFEKIVKKYVKVTVKDRFIESMKPIIYAIKKK